VTCQSSKLHFKLHHRHQYPVQTLPPPPNTPTPVFHHIDNQRSSYTVTVLIVQELFSMAPCHLICSADELVLTSVVSLRPDRPTKGRTCRGLTVKFQPPPQTVTGRGINELHRGERISVEGLYCLRKGWRDFYCVNWACFM
jgi:hypothetical protein